MSHTMKIRPVGASCSSRMDRQTHRQADMMKLLVDLRNFVNKPKSLWCYNKNNNNNDDDDDNDDNNNNNNSSTNKSKNRD